MSLKTFHIFFIVISTLCALGLGSWAVREYRRIDGLDHLIMAVCSFVGAAVLLCYGRWFMHKLKGMES